jgi:Ca2+/H+ antiporter, TMEM165/GDT1 family
MMDAFLVSAGIVALSEVGDKTQLLALLLAARFKQPLPILAGILVATILNHAAAGVVGVWLGDILTETANQAVLAWILGGLFIAMGLWALKPDTLDQTEVKPAATFAAIFWVTAVAFFLAEMGDKTQIATAALAARYAELWAVVAGTTIGMLIADAPAVFLGQAAGAKLTQGWVRYVAAAVFVVMGVATIASIG